MNFISRAALLFWAALLFPQVAFATEKSLLEQDLELQSTCRALPGWRDGEPVIAMPEDGLICLNAIIFPEVADKFLEMTNDLEPTNEAHKYTLLIDSPGGSVSDAIRMGYRIRDKGIRVVVDRYCASSCANYVIASTPRLAVLPHSLVFMHGSLPRTRWDFATMQVLAQGIPEGEIFNNLDLQEKEWNKFPEYARSELREQDDFMVDMKVEEYYLTRYFFVDFNAWRLSSEECKPKRGVGLIVGPEYYGQFTSRNIDYFWMPDPADQKWVKKNFTGIYNDFDLYYEFEALPRSRVGEDRQSCPLQSTAP